MNPMRCLVPMLAVLALAACAGTPDSGVASATDAPASGPLDGERWSLTSVSAGPLAKLPYASRVTMEFDEGRVFGYGGCNRYQGAYTVTGERLEIGQVASTMMYCEGEGNEVERAWHELLKQPFGMSRQSGVLRLTASDGTQLRFVEFATQ